MYWPFTLHCYDVRADAAAMTGDPGFDELCMSFTEHVYLRHANFSCRFVHLRRGDAKGIAACSFSTDPR